MPGKHFNFSQLNDKTSFKQQVRPKFFHKKKTFKKFVLDVDKIQKKNDVTIWTGNEGVT